VRQPNRQMAVEMKRDQIWSLFYSTQKRKLAIYVTVTSIMKNLLCSVLLCFTGVATAVVKPSVELMYNNHTIMPSMSGFWFIFSPLGKLAERAIYFYDL